MNTVASPTQEKIERDRRVSAGLIATVERLGAQSPNDRADALIEIAIAALCAVCFVLSREVADELLIEVPRVVRESVDYDRQKGMH